MSAIAVAAVSFVVSALGIWRVRHYALRHQVLDIPNARSSHRVPTPRGAGAAVVAAMLLMFWASQAAQGTFQPAVLIPFGGILVVAVIGWRDDRASAGVGIRLICHALGGLSLLPLVLASSRSDWMPLVAAAWLFWAISTINVVNFMDGIDGLVGSQALVFGAHLAVLGTDGPPGMFGAALAGATAGFLVWNWAPAKIFLGDVGSGALGLAFVFGGAWVGYEKDVSPVVVFLPLYPMFLDASVTLVRRAFKGERVVEAHRTHLYQRLANGGLGHARVSSLYAVVACLGSAVGIAHRQPGWTVLAMIYLVIVAAGWLWLSNGRPTLSHAGG